MNSRPTQAAEILRFLEDHGSITPLDAMRFGCMRLAARIHELKRNGHAIDCDKSEGFARYSLAVVPA